MNKVNYVNKKEKDFQEVERLVQKSRLTQKDVDELTKKVEEDARKYVKKLMKIK